MSPGETGRVQRGLNLLSRGRFYDWLVRLSSGSLLRRTEDDLLADAFADAFQAYGIPSAQPAASSESSRGAGELRVLLCGGGTGGIFLRLLRLQNRRDQAASLGRVCRVDYVELSEGMLRETQRRLQSARDLPLAMRRGVRLLHADLRDWLQQIANDAQRQTRYDRILFPFVLDFFATDEVASILEAARGSLAPQGRIGIVDFAHENLLNASVGPLRRGLFRMIVRLLYAFFGRIAGLSARSLPDFRAAWTRADLKPIGLNKSRAGGLLFTQLLASRNED